MLTSSRNNDDTADFVIIKKAALLHLSRAFPNDDLLLAFGGSSNKAYHSELYSDIDLYAHVNSENLVRLDLGTTEKFCSAIRNIVAEVETDGIYLVPFAGSYIESLLEGLVKCSLEAKMKNAQTPDIKLLQCLFFPNHSSQLAYPIPQVKINFLSKGEIILGSGRVKERIAAISNPNPSPSAHVHLPPTVTYEQIMLNNYITLRSNLHLPYEVLAKHSVRNIKFCLTKSIEIFLYKNYKIETSTIGDQLEHLSKLPEKSSKAFMLLEDIRSRQKVPQEEELIEFYKKSADAINEITYAWL